MQSNCSPSEKNLTCSLWKGRDEKDFICLGGRSEKSILQLTLLLTSPLQHNHTLWYAQRASIWHVLNLRSPSQHWSCTHVLAPLKRLPRGSAVLWDMWFSGLGEIFYLYRAEEHSLAGIRAVKVISFSRIAAQSGCVCFRSFNLPKQQSISLALLAAESLQCPEAAASSNKTPRIHLSRCAWHDAS